MGRIIVEKGDVIAELINPNYLKSEEYCVEICKTFDSFQRVIKWYMRGCYE